MSDSGWYPDPDRADQLRYWDGTTWTEHTTTANQRSRVPTRTSMKLSVALLVAGGLVGFSGYVYAFTGGYRSGTAACVIAILVGSSLVIVSLIANWVTYKQHRSQGSSLNAPIMVAVADLLTLMTMVGWLASWSLIFPA